MRCRHIGKVTNSKVICRITGKQCVLRIPDEIDCRDGNGIIHQMMNAGTYSAICYNSQYSSITKMTREEIQAELAHLDEECERLAASISALKDRGCLLNGELRRIKEAEEEAYAARSMTVKDNWGSYIYYYKGKEIPACFKQARITFPNGNLQVFDIHWKEVVHHISDHGHSDDVRTVVGYFTMNIYGADVEREFSPSEKALIIEPL